MKAGFARSYFKNYYSIFICFQDNANSMKAQLDQQKNVVENLVSNTRVS